MHTLQSTRTLLTGAGRGLGREMARQFAAAGSEVIVTDRDLSGVEETVAMIRSEKGRAAGYVMDITNPEAVRNVRDEVLRDRGPIDVLVNNAGCVFGGPFSEIPLASHLTTFQVNTLGMINVTYAFLPDLLQRPEAHIVNVSSAAGIVPLPFAATYAASKWAVLGFTESLGDELRLQGNGHVQVTTVCPSYISTGLFAGVQLPRFSRLLTADRVARATLNAVLRNREKVLLPWFVKLTPFLKGVLPRPLARVLCNWLGVSTGMVSWRGQSHVVPSVPPAGRQTLGPPACESVTKR